ncbi:hypothetical protein AGMMS50230_19590 [Spirochaetia bacterium]|nr:hypothetical protein AGMMS50230_19590 [Spirochaetia bacterium]
MTVQMIFSLRFQSQLRRTRQKLLRDLEKTIIEAIEGYGGKVRVEHKLISSVFDSETIGFWLDILCVLEAVKNALEKNSSELYGHVCIMGQDIAEEDIAVLVRALPSDLWGTGIWCAEGLRPFLDSFIDFDEALEGGQVNGYAQIRAIRELADSEFPLKLESRFPLKLESGEGHGNSEKIRQYLKQGNRRNTVIVGEENIGKREGIYRYCREELKGFPPFVIRFSPGANMASCLVDALTPELREALRGCPEFPEIEQLGVTLFQERLRDELSEFTIKQGERFFSLLLGACRSRAENAGVKPLLVLENIQDADPMARLIITGIHCSLPARERFHLYSTCITLEALKPWEEIFPRIVKFTPEKTASPSLPVLPRDLWEMGYGCALFKRYFPAFLLPQLFKEEGKNPVMVEKALLILSRLQINGNADFITRAEKALEEGTAAARTVVHSRLLAWVEDFRLKPCFGLLKALASLGKTDNENLILDSVCADITNGTFRGIETAIEDGSFGLVVGKERETALLAITRSQKVLIHGNQAEIEDVFKEGLTSPSSVHPAFRTRIFTNTASYQLGVGENAAASLSIKDAMLLTQNENGGRGLARIYRLFSLTEFASHHLSDAIDYFAFAVENAEKSGDYGELGISAYYAASAHFIFGNISKARRLVVQGREAALTAVLPGWADRCRFMEGRFCFETGAYQEALDIFEDLKASHLSPAAEDFNQTLAAWIYRANIYLRNNAKHLGGEDARLFEIEAAFITGEYRKALELANKQEKTTLEPFIFIEKPDWRSGFCQCELFLFPLQDLQDRIVQTYRALAVCYMNGGEALEKDEAIREMQRIMRDELPQTDPNDAFYCYSYYRILKRTGAPEVDMNTAVSIAFKRLQKRASRIDNNETKRLFLSSHYWNGALAEAAREHKLI